MRVEFNYALDDLREVGIPQAQAGDVRKYRRRWIRGAIAWGIIVAMFALQYALFRTGVRLPEPERPEDDLLLEIIPPGIPAAFVLLIYGITMWRAWKTSRFRDPPRAPAAANPATRVKLIRATVFVTFGAAAYFAIGIGQSLTWHPSKTQLVLVRLAPWTLVVGAMILFGRLQLAWTPRKKWYTQPTWRRTKVIVLDERGFSMSDALTATQLSWAAFTSARETENLLVLQTEDGLQYVLPKRAFDETAEVERCRALLQNVIPKTTFLVRPGGFAVLPKPVLPAIAQHPEAPQPAQP